METTAEVYFQSAAHMDEVADQSVDLVVTSPPYPMIEMWDEQFFAQDSTLEEAFETEEYETAFSRMHDVLYPVWSECVRVLKRGGILCINVGDATRTLGDNFQLYANHARIVNDVVDLGLHPLPGILWRKSTNKPNKFMGSGMIPPNAYVTLEHEHILIFRKDGKRRVKPDRREDRYESAYFWEERNQWFSDVWTDLTGISQTLSAQGSDLRERSAAFPLKLPLRLINMFSIAGDTVLDPFWGTGTTSLAAAMLRRNSIGYEIEEGFGQVFRDMLDNLGALSQQYNQERIERHLQFLREREAPCKNHNTFYDFGVVTRQEEDLALYDVDTVKQTAEHRCQFSYQPHGIQKELFVA